MKLDWGIIILGIISLAIGYYLNKLANERNNVKLIEALKEELNNKNNNINT